MLVLAAAAGIAAAPAHAGYPGRNGAVAFVGDRGGETRLYVRTGHRTVARLTGPVADPAWSPEGQRLAVTRGAPGGGRAVWVMFADGLGARPVTDAAVDGGEPTWRPDGRMLAYAAGPVGQRTIHAVRPDGTGDRAITAGPADQHAPAWGPDGTIAFVERTSTGEDIFTVPVAGGVPSRLTVAPGDDTSPAWSPDGERLAFVRGGDGVWVMNRFGGAQRRVVDLPGGMEAGVAWAPDGKLLLVAGGPPGKRQVYRVGLHGEGLRALSLPASNGRDPDWQSAGHPPVIAAAGDVACDPAWATFKGGLGTRRRCGMLRTSNLLLRPDLAAVLVLGDEQYPDGDLGRFYGSFGPSWGRLRPITRPVPGNHEYLTPGAAGYFDFFDGAGVRRGPAGDRTRGGYYSFDLGAWHIVALDSNCPSVPGGCGQGSPQQRWLERDLIAHRTKCTLAFWHHPLFSSLSREEGRGSRQTKALWNTLYELRADVVLSGHQHFYERLSPQDPDGNLDQGLGMPSFVVGTGGKGLDQPTFADRSRKAFDNASFGILELTLLRDRFRWRYRTTNGNPFRDAGEAPCH